MNETFYYEIADHLIAVETPDAETAKPLLRNYEPFRIGRDVARNVSTQPILHFTLGKEINIPNIPPTDEMEAQDIRSVVYTTADFTYATTQINGLTYAMRATKDWQQVETDLLLQEPVHTIFLKSFITTAYGAATAQDKTIKLHASCIEKDGRALLFLGVSGTGKSTHSRLWLEHVPGCSLLNDDEPIVRILNDGSVRVYGAPWSGSTPCYRNASAEVAAIVHLHQHIDNILTRLDATSAISSMLISAAMLRSDAVNKNRVMDTILGLLNTVPVYRLDCRPDREAVALTETLMTGFSTT